MFNRTAPLLLLILAAILSASAQTSPPPSPNSASTAPAAQAADLPMPKDPNALMQLAARVNGLGSPELKPWHLKANYQTFDADGKPKDQGVFEEWWAAPDKYKISYASSSFNQVQYHSVGKVWMAGDTKWPPAIEDKIDGFLKHPLPSAEALAKQQYVSVDAKDGNVALSCVRPAAPSGYSAALTYCLSKETPALRVEVPYSQRMAFFNDLVVVNSHYLAKQIQVLNTSKSYLNVDVTTLEFPPTMDEAIFVVPAAATAAPIRKVLVSAGVISGNLISGTSPEYPHLAKSARIEGVVVLRADITTDGKIDDVRVISGPPMLQQAAVDAVWTWRYRPYFLNGNPVVVETQINITFSLKR